MRRVACVLSLLLALVGLLPSAVLGQSAGQEAQQQRFQLRQNYPNPFNPETRIPFELYEGLFVDGKTAVVSLRIFNVLQQFVAAPTALNHPSGEARMINLEYSQPGQHEAYWDGLDLSGRQVASGIYFVQIIVNGEKAILRMWVSK